MDLFKGRKREGKATGDSARTRERPSRSGEDTVEIAAVRDDGAGTSGSPGAHRAGR